MRALARRAPRALPHASVVLWAYAALLVAWGNAASALLGPSAALPGGSWAYVLSGLVLVAGSLAIVRILGLDGAALGLDGGALRGAAIGLAVGGAASLASVPALRLVAPLVVGHAVDYAPLAQVTATDLLRHVAVFLPLGVILPEEIAFRGVLLGAIHRARGARSAIVVAAVAFALWHGTVVLGTVADTTIGPTSPWSAIAIAGAFLVVAAGGAAFALLRLLTGSLATTIAAHWTFDVVVLVGLWWTR